jgi:hypothetical protein
MNPHQSDETACAHLHNVQVVTKQGGGGGDQQHEVVGVGGNGVLALGFLPTKTLNSV